MSTCTHVSDSLASAELSVSKAVSGSAVASVASQSIASAVGSKASMKFVADNEVAADDHEIEKEHFVIEHVVETLFSSKKRKLKQSVDDEISRAVKQREKVLDCKCGCLVPCAKKIDLLRNYKVHVTQNIWPKLEKELVRDLAQTLYHSKKTNECLTKELVAVTRDKVILETKLAFIASVF